MASITSEQFKRALSSIGPLTEGQRRFLQEHYRAVGRVSTMSNLARAAGYRGYGGVNLQYGILAKRIAKVLHRPVPAIRVEVVAEFVEPTKISNKDWVLHMRPAFASALRSLKLVK
jgi:hypothetical protein